ncbi:hypothetical protein [Pyrodictium delaneyi]|nr:hypothetical protein [Pyrodictium delaneyi]
MSKRLWKGVHLRDLIMLSILVVIVAVNPSIPLGLQGKGEVCIAPFATVKLQPTNYSATQQVSGYTLLYIPCSELGCGIAGGNTTLKEAEFPARGGEQYLGPALIHTILIKLKDGSLLPPTIMESSSPGTVEVIWNYPIVHGSALLILDANQAYIVLKGAACGNKLEVPGCRLVEQTSTCSFLVKCDFNIEAKGNLESTIWSGVLFRDQVSIGSVGCWVEADVERALLLRPIGVALLIILVARIAKTRYTG